MKMEKSKYWSWVVDKSQPMYIFIKGNVTFNVYYKDVKENMKVKWMVYVRAFFIGVPFKYILSFNKDILTE